MEEESQAGGRVGAAGQVLLTAASAQHPPGMQLPIQGALAVHGASQL